LVRQYQLTISLQAECCEPCLGIASKKNLHFKARESLSVNTFPNGLENNEDSTATDEDPTLGLADGSQLRFYPPQHTITVTNLSDSPTEVTICNSTMFFVIRGISQAIEGEDPSQLDRVTFANAVTESTYQPGSPRRREDLEVDGSMSPQSDAGETGSCPGTPHRYRSFEGSHGRESVPVVETVDVGAVGGVISGQFEAKQLRATLQPGGELVVVVVPNFQSITKMCEQLMKEKYVEEHLTIYSRDNPREHRWRQLRMHFVREHSSGMEEEIEFFSTKGGAQSYPFQVLEESVVHFLRNFRLKVDRWAATGARTNGVADAETDERAGRIGSRIGGGTTREAEGGGDERVDGDADGVFEEEQSSSSTWDAVGSIAGATVKSAVNTATHGDSASFSVKDLHDLLFELHYITDELVYSALKDPGAIRGTQS
jgi:hypothetical protein